jgi:hypothetical protein
VSDIGFDRKRISPSNSDIDYATVTRFKIVSFVFGGVWQERATTSGETRLAVEKITEPFDPLITNNRLHWMNQ